MDSEAEIDRNRYFAFLRAINVGGRNIKMEELRGLFEELIFENVDTFIASGNVIFESNEEDQDKLETKIEDHLIDALGYEVTTFVRSGDELEAIFTYRPFSKSELEAEGNKLYVAFLKNPLEKGDIDKVTELKTDVDDFTVHNREVYWLRRMNAGNSEFSGGVLEKTLGMDATMRTMRTVERILSKFD